MPPVTTTWHPVLTGELADRAADAVREISEALTELPAELPGSASLVDGDAGIGLFEAYLDRAFPGNTHGESSRRHIERAVDALAAAPMPAELYAGFTGVAFVAEHLATGGDTAASGHEDINEAIDAALAAGGLSSLESYELIAGLTGIGIYALERRHRASATRLIESVIERLAELSEQTERGIAWHTEPMRDSIPVGARPPEPFYNLGVAHGVSGVIGFLGQSCSAGIAERQARELLEGAVSWLLARRSEDGDGADFPAWISATTTSPPNRMSWCHGSLGMAVALFVAARAVGEPSWEREAGAIALACAARDIAGSRVLDPSLCHGSAGNGHLFNRLFQATGDARFRYAATGWFQRALDLRKPGSGLAGFESVSHDGHGGSILAGRPGFLTGVSGIGLAFLAATTTIEPSWDRLMLAAIPGKE